MSATMLNSTWNIPTPLLLAVEHLFGGRFAGSNYIGTELYLLWLICCALYAILCIESFKNSLIGLTNPVIAVAKTERKLR